MTELERLRQELIEVRNLLLRNVEAANVVAWTFHAEEAWENKSFHDGRCDAFEDAAALLTRLIELKD